jgi:hypothetical protein
MSASPMSENEDGTTPRSLLLDTHEAIQIRKLMIGDQTGNRYHPPRHAQRSRIVELPVVNVV